MPSGSRILIVDDEPFLLNAVSALLRSAGYEVETCEQWVGVAATVRAFKPDVVLLDYNMPSLRGDDICRALKRNEREGSRMRVVLFSSEPEGDLERIAERCGADGFICKHVPSTELVMRVSGVVNALPDMA
jgi:DNA-binding response OmpR family regulator